MIYCSIVYLKYCILLINVTIISLKNNKSLNILGFSKNKNKEALCIYICQLKFQLGYWFCFSGELQLMNVHKWFWCCPSTCKIRIQVAVVLSSGSYDTQLFPLCLPSLKILGKENWQNLEILEWHSFMRKIEILCIYA